MRAPPSPAAGALPGLKGDPDYLLHVVSADLDAYRRLYDERLATLPGVQRLTSTLVMADVVAERPLPLNPRRPGNDRGPG